MTGVSREEAVPVSDHSFHPSSIPPLDQFVNSNEAQIRNLREIHWCIDLQLEIIYL